VYDSYQSVKGDTSNYDDSSSYHSRNHHPTTRKRNGDTTSTQYCRSTGLNRKHESNGSHVSEQQYGETPVRRLASSIFARMLYGTFSRTTTGVQKAFLLAYYSWSYHASGRWADCYSSVRLHIFTSSVDHEAVRGNQLYILCDIPNMILW
jgi:hypothetical protein